MRIAWITYDFEEYSVLQAGALAAADHDVLLVIPQTREGTPPYQIPAAVDTFAFRKPRLRQPLAQLRSIREILERIDAFRPDVVHFQQGHLWFNAALSRLRQRYPLVLTIHDPRHHAGDTVSRKTPQWVLDHGFRQADHAIVHGAALKADVHRYFGLDRSRIHIIPHVAMGALEPASVGDLASRNGAPKDDAPTVDRGLTGALPTRGPQVLFFGRIWQYKGLEYLIRAEPMITRAVPDARIVIAGEGEDIARYRSQMQNPDHFIVHNRWISDTERAQFFEQATVVVLPYIEATQSGVIPVAHNFRKPVVATRVGAIPDCVVDGETGLLVPPRDPAALAAAIVELLRDPLRGEAMGRAGYDRLQHSCSPAAVAKMTAAVYQRAAADRREDEVTADRHPPAARRGASSKIASGAR